jgi:hypothetical protein
MRSASKLDRPTDAQQPLRLNKKSKGERSMGQTMADAAAEERERVVRAYKAVVEASLSETVTVDYDEPGDTAADVAYMRVHSIYPESRAAVLLHSPVNCFDDVLFHLSTTAGGQAATVAFLDHLVGAGTKPSSRVGAALGRRENNYHLTTINQCIFSQHRSRLC